MAHTTRMQRPTFLGTSVPPVGNCARSFDLVVMTIARFASKRCNWDARTVKKATEAWLNPRRRRHSARP